MTDGISATDKRLVFIGGLTAYEQAGGAVTRDLLPPMVDLQTIRRLSKVLSLKNWKKPFPH
ncbi:hypothetical protein [Agrobacterium tumefaciens]|uniref:hypothetical protein n=1 Tax=Agrobacterium tumefaciens TaxID=358 RepID=UPI0021CDEF7B|nr:hypothetical protein [Agrobacterium tumefaciens]